MTTRPHRHTPAFLLALATAAAGLALGAPAAAKDDAPAAMLRRTVNLPALADESNARLVLTAGKTIETDGVNRYFLSGTFKAETDGDKVVFRVQTGPVGSTRMAAPPGHPKGREFVAVSSGLLPYDSKRALLIDAPAELRLSYQVWNAKGTEVFDPAAEAAAIKQTGRNMKAYKPAEPGTVRHVIALPKLADEHAAKVEILAGKTLSFAGKAESSFGGKVTESDIAGWGFPRFDVTLGELNGPKPDPQGDTRKFVSIGGEPQFFRYNSRLPLVVYAPQDVEIRHRVWRPGAKVEVDQDA